MDEKQLENIFTYHKPFGKQAERYEALRLLGADLAVHILRNCPESREMSVAITKVQEAIMWANASIAINEEELK